MNTEQQVNLEEMVEDIHAQMIDSELMEKYHVSAGELKAAFKHLIEAKVLSLTELYRRPVLSDETIDAETRRKLPRYRLAFLVPVHESVRPEARGWVVNITEKGMQTTGIEARIGESKVFAVAPRRMKDGGEIVFAAECRWKRTEGPDEVPIAGFRITEISQEQLRKLRNFIGSITLGDCPA